MNTAGWRRRPVFHYYFHNSINLINDMNSDDITLLSGFHKVSSRLQFCIFQGGTPPSTQHPHVSQTHTHTHTLHHTPYTNTMFYLCELLKGQLEATSVVGDPLGIDILHSLFQHPLVADVGLHQVLKAWRVRCLFIELGGRGKEGWWEVEGRHLHIFVVKYVACFDTDSCRVP